MKKLLALILAVVMIFSLAACGKEKEAEKYCFNCGEGISEIVAFCPYCGVDLSLSTENSFTNAPIDYSEFGFQNNYNMTEWLEIDDYNFEDPNNAYVIVRKNSGYYVRILENGYYTKKYFGSYNRDPIYKGDSNIGDTYDVYPYNIVNNYLIILQDTNKTKWEIDVIFESGIPIILNTKKRFDMDPVGFIPTNFIDWTRDVEWVEKDNGTFGGTLKYYINCENNN